MRERTPCPAAGARARCPACGCVVTGGMRNAAVDLDAAAARAGSPSAGCRAPPPRRPSWPGRCCSACCGRSRRGRRLRAGRWQSTVGTDLAGSTSAWSGSGKLGSRMVPVAQAFGMQVLAWSPNLTDEAASAVGATRVDKAELFRRSDVVSLHLVLSERSRGIVGRDELALLGPHGLPGQHLPRRAGRPRRRCSTPCTPALSPARRSTSSTTSRCRPTTRCSARRGPCSRRTSATSPATTSRTGTRGAVADLRAFAAGAPVHVLAGPHGQQRDVAPVEDVARRVPPGRCGRRRRERRCARRPPAGPGSTRSTVDGAGERVALAHRAGVVAAVPGDDRDELGQCPDRLGQRQADGVAAVDEPLAAPRRRSACARRSASAGRARGRSRRRRRRPRARSSPARAAGRAGSPGSPSRKAVRSQPAADGARVVDVGADGAQVVGVPGLGARVAQRQHRAAPEVEDGAVGLVDRRDAQGHQAGRRSVRDGCGSAAARPPRCGSAGRRRAAGSRRRASPR